MAVVPAAAPRGLTSEPTPAQSAVPAAIELSSITQRFDRVLALDGVSLSVRSGAVHALLGPNGAGKTTLLRIAAGLLVPDAGDIRVLAQAVGTSRAFRRQIGLVPSGDRSFYLRISGLENLLFFARLHGFRRRDGVRRSLELLEQVGLADAARKPVGLYSHGMQKRLSVARALLADPPILLVDEATHDLDPEGARRVRDLVLECAQGGAAVIWATQRLDEIRGLADGVTLIAHGQAAFAGTVAELMAHAVPRRYLVRLRGSVVASASPSWTLEPAGTTSSEHYVLALGDDVVLGEALADLSRSGVEVLTCREERSEIEEAFLSLTENRR
jgi:ABC-type multidrug transport system ATPase subunit